MILKDYKISDENYSLELNTKLLDKIVPGEENKTATIKVKNETLLDRENVKVKFMQGGEVVDEKTILKLSSGQCVDITVDLRQMNIHLPLRHYLNLVT